MLKSCLLRKEEIKYNNNSGYLKQGDIIEVIVDRDKGNLTYSVNGVDYGKAFSDIPNDQDLFPTITIFQEGHSVEII